MDAWQTGPFFLAEFQKEFCSILVLQSRLLTSGVPPCDGWSPLEVKPEFRCGLALAALIDKSPSPPLELMHPPASCFCLAQP